MESKKTILIIEDDISMLGALRDKLKLEGFSVLEAKNGEKGLAIALDRHPDLVLLDIVMPVMDGMTMLEKLHEDVWGKDAKVIILTNLSDIDVAHHSSFDYLVKSDWKIEDVAARIRERLEK